MTDVMAALDTYLEAVTEQEKMQVEILRLQESEEMAWVLIANAYGGNWDLASDEWRQAAIKWRDNYHPQNLSSESSL